MSENRVPYCAGPPPPPKEPQLEGLLVDRDRLVRMLRISHEELHARRRTTPNPADEADIGELLRYWDEVFEWIKQQHGAADMVLMRRNHS